MRVTIIGIGEVRLVVRRGEEAAVMCSGMRWGGRRLGGDIEGEEEEEEQIMSGDVHCLDQGG